MVDAMPLKEYATKIEVRKISRSLYALIPHEVTEELQIKEGETAVVLLDREQRIIAYKFGKR